MKGFTLIETMVAITILSLALLAPFAAMQQVIRATSLSRDQVIAASLAQEGIEYVRFVRYTNWLRAEDSDPGNFDPLDGLDGNGGPSCLYSGSNQPRCTVDATADPYNSSGTLTGMSQCGGASHQNCQPLYVTSEGLYTQVSSGNTRTPYTRYVWVTRPSGTNPGYVTVNSRVTWNNKGTQTMTITENLYDWL